MKNPVIDNESNKRWYNENGKYHRLDGPACEWINGNKWWFENGERHRLGGPAIESADGDKEWFVNGKLHRLDGPAIEYNNIVKSWYINDNELSEDLHTQLTVGDIRDLPLYLGLGFDDYISERLKG